jgi:hypothetical protein
MGFPEKFRLMELTAGQSMESLIFEHYRMLGNAVCPPVIAVLAGALLSHLHGTTSAGALCWERRGYVAMLQLAFGAVSPLHRAALLSRLQRQYTADSERM